MMMLKPWRDLGQQSTVNSAEQQYAAQRSRTPVPAGFSYMSVPRLRLSGDYGCLPRRKSSGTQERLSQHRDASRQRASMLPDFVSKACTLDLAFLCDTTCSMEDSIEYIKTEITDMVDQICASGPHCVIRLAFVGYTDYGCPEVPHQDFSEDIGAFEKLLDTIEVSGLGINRDNAEDVFSGLQAAGKLSWTSTNRILVHVGDAPCHGQEFHEYPSGEFKDKYPDGDKLGRDAGELLLHLAETCKLDRYIFCHLSAMTKKMIQRFQQLLGKSHAGLLQEHEDKGQLSTIRLASVGASTGCLARSQSTRSHKSSFVQKDVDSNAPTLLSAADINATLHALRVSSCAQEQLRRISCFQKLGGCEAFSANVTLAPCPFTREGTSKWPFYGFCDAMWIKGDCVVKRLKTPMKYADDEAEYHSKGRYYGHMEIAALAAAMATGFTSRLAERGGQGSVTYLPQYLMELPRVNGETDIFLLEKRIKDSFVHFSNNVGVINIDVDAELVHAFSHWTFVASEGRVMVTDLQGAKKGNNYTLTDPTVHCSIDLARFNATNLGTPGMEAFFCSHECGPTCTILGLGIHDSQALLNETDMDSLGGDCNDWIVFD